MTSDAELVERHLTGDRRAFDEIVSRYERRVWAVCLRMCGNPDDARDAAQETFLTAFRSLRSFRGDAQLSTWLHRVAVNSCLDLLRKRGRRHDQPLDDVPDAASGDPAPEDIAIASQRAREVRRALLRISDDHRAVLVLHDLQGLQYAEVAEALDVPVGTVKSRLHRARLEMARLLGHLSERDTSEPTEGRRPLT